MTTLVALSSNPESGSPEQAVGWVSQYIERTLVIYALIAAGVFIAAGIGRSVWLDEANAVLIASHGFSGIVDSLSRDNNLPVYYFLLSVWMRLFGDSEIALRALSAVFYLGGCGAAYVLGKRLTGGRRVGLYCALFYECSTLAVRQAQNIRMYAMLGMLSALSVWCFLRIFRDKDYSGRAWIWFLTLNAMGLLTHVWFVFVLAGQFAAAAIFARKQLGRFLLGVAGAAVPFGLLWGRLFWGQLHNGATGWMPRLQPGFWIYAPLEFYGLLPVLFLYILVIAAAGIAGYGKWKRIAPVAIIFLVSLAVPLAISAIRPIYWPGRYAIIAVAPLAAVLGSCIATLLPRPLAAGIGMLLLSMQLAAHVSQRDRLPDAQLPLGQSDRTTASFLLAHASHGDVVIFTSLTRAAADYYLRRAGASRRFVEISFPAEVATHLGWNDPAVSTERQPLLDAEAAETASRLCALAARGSRVWMYDGFTPRVNRFLRDQLDSRLTLRGEYLLEGPYHKRILEYGTPLTVH